MAFFRKEQITNSDFIDDNADDVFDDIPSASQKQNSGSFGGFNMSQSGSALELKVVRPEKFADVLMVADHLIAGRTVVIDFGDTNRDTVKRIKDFLGGVAYSIDGQLQRVANNTYIATPNNVDVSDENGGKPKSQASFGNNDDLSDM